MKTKKLVSIVLSTVLLTGTLVGCGSKPASTDGSNTSTGNGEKVKLTAIVTKHPLTKDVNEIEWLQKIEEETNVEIEWQQITADWDQKKGTLLASGDIPDLIFGPGAVNDSDFAQFPGLFEDLIPLIEKDAPNIKKMFSEKPVLKTIATQLDGKIYGLPKYQRFWPSTVTRQFINKQWLDKLGLKEPTNWDELYDVLMAFKTKDPNGNGKADEIPMDWAPGLGWFNAMYMLGGAGLPMTNGVNGGIFVEDGKVKYIYNDERYRTLVQFLNKCFKAGLINPEVFTQDYTKFQSVARGNGDEAKLGFSFGWEVMDRVGAQLAPQYKTIAPLKPSASYNGKVTWEYCYDNLNYGANMVSLSANSKNKDAAMKFIDKFYDPVVSMQVLFGSIGPNIKDNGDGSYTVLPPTDSKMDPGTWKWTSTFADNGPMYVADSIKLTLGTDMQSIGEQTAVFDPYLKQRDPKKDIWPGVFIKFSADDNNQLALVRTNLTNLTETKWANWIQNGGIDKEWDSYVQELEKAGLKQFLEIHQKYYDEYMKNQK